MEQLPISWSSPCKYLSDFVNSLHPPHEKNLCLIVAAFIGFSPLARAVIIADVVWDSVQNISGDGDVSNQGTLYAAAAFGDSSVSSSTVNGVTFSAFAISGTDSLIFHGNIGLAGGGSSILPNNALGSTSSPFSGLSSSYQQLLSSGAQMGDDNGLIIDMLGLTVGQTYKIQLWVNVSTASGQNDNTQANGRHNSVNLIANTTSEDGGLGQYVIGTFTAGHAIEAIDIEQLGSDSATVNAFQIRTASVPEPSALALLSIVGSAVLWRARRK